MNNTTLLALLGTAAVAGFFLTRKKEVRLPQTLPDGSQTLPGGGDAPRGRIQTRIVPSR